MHLQLLSVHRFVLTEFESEPVVYEQVDGTDPLLSSFATLDGIKVALRTYTATSDVPYTTKHGPGLFPAQPQHVLSKVRCGKSQAVR